MARTVEVLRDRSEIVHRALALVCESYDQAIAARDRFTFVAAGGSTPRPLYELIAAQPFDWSKVHVFWGDERYVPASDPQSNQGMTRKAWLDRVAIPAANIHAVPTDSGDPIADADRYENHLREFFQLTQGTLPVFDFVLLGMGDDGHTASLFPFTEALSVRDRLITTGQKDGQPRITMTYPLLNNSDRLVFLVEGLAKAPALAAVFAEIEDDQRYPSRGIRKDTIWLCDRFAAGVDHTP